VIAKLNLLQVEDYAPVCTIWPSPFHRNVHRNVWIQPKWQLSIGRRGRKSGHHGHKDFSQMCLWRGYIEHKSLIVLLYFFGLLIENTFYLCFGTLHFSLFGPTNEGDVGPWVARVSYLPLIQITILFSHHWFTSQVELVEPKVEPTHMDGDP